MQGYAYSECFCRYRYGVHKRKYYIDGREVDRCMIVIKDVATGLIKEFTSLGDYAVYMPIEDLPVSETGISCIYSVINFLNYVFVDNWKKYGINTLRQIEVRHIEDYLNTYADTRTRSGGYPSRQTIRNKRASISKFMIGLIRSCKMNIREDEIVEYRFVRNPKGSYGGRFVPRYKIHFRYHNESMGGYKMLYRDMPLAIAQRLISMAETFDPEIAFALVLQLLVGLRSGEVCNIRQNTSVYGPCFRVTYADDAKTICTGIEIDLLHEYPMRGDGKTVGRIKRERCQSVFPPFQAQVEESYRRHLELIKGKPVEEARPMFLTKRPDKKNGVYMAMTVSAYRDRVLRLFNEHVLPSCRNDADPMMRSFYHEMQGHTWGPHSCRHWYTVALILCGVDNVAQLMNYRGDKSPRSAITYLERKGELNNRYRKAVNKLGGIIRK